METYFGFIKTVNIEAYGEDWTPDEFSGEMGTFPNMQYMWPDEMASHAASRGRAALNSAPAPALFQESSPPQPCSTERPHCAARRKQSAGSRQHRSNRCQHFTDNIPHLSCGARGSPTVTRAELPFRSSLRPWLTPMLFPRPPSSKPRPAHTGTYHWWGLWVPARPRRVGKSQQTQPGAACTPDPYRNSESVSWNQAALPQKYTSNCRELNHASAPPPMQPTSSGHGPAPRLASEDGSENGCRQQMKERSVGKAHSRLPARKMQWKEACGRM